VPTSDPFFDEDEKGFAALKSEQFVEYKNMLFRRSAFSTTHVDELLSGGNPPHTVQLQVNHVSMISYGADVSLQNKHAQDLVGAWLSTAKHNFPYLYVWVAVEYSEAEAVVSVRAVARS